MPEVVMVIAPETFRDEEYSEPKHVLESRGASVTTASTAPGECIGKLGMRAMATMSVATATERTWDAVVFVGGAGARVFFDDPAAHTLARDAVSRGSVLGAICIAPSVLAHAGLLDGVHATAFPSQEEDLRAHGAHFDARAVVTSGRIVTANGPESATPFGDALAEMLGLPEAGTEDAAGKDR